MQHALGGNLRGRDRRLRFSVVRSTKRLIIGPRRLILGESQDGALAHSVPEGE